MYLKKSTNSKTGRTQLTIAHGYRDKDGKTKQKTIQNLGYLDVLEKQYENPIAYFEEVVKQMNEEQKKKNAAITLTFGSNEKIQMDTTYRKNFGYVAYSKFYHELKINEFINNRRRYTNADFNHNAIFKLLTYSRLLYPGSKKLAYEHREKFFENTDYSLDDVYRSLKFFKKHKNALMLWMHEQITALYGRDTSLVYYDVTNYYFEIDKQDEMRRKGYGKDRKGDPIVQRGLFIDSNGLPIYYGLFSGNTVDSKTLLPMTDKIQDDYNMGKIIIVADKGIITGDNIAQTIVDGNGYVFSYSIRGADKSFKEYVLDEKDYVSNNDKTFKIKSRKTPRSIHVTNMLTGKKQYQTVDEIHVVFYNEKYAKRAKHERDLAIAKAEKLIANPSLYEHSQNYGASKYILNFELDKDENISEDVAKSLKLDEEKIKEEEKYDGYYAIVSSEVDKSPSEIVEIYRGLWKIEESFKVTKSYLEARPVYLSLADHIDAHFLTCFVALLLQRLLEFNLNNKHSTEKIIDSLKKCSCSLAKENYYIFDYYDEVLLDIGNIINVDFSNRILTLDKIKKYLASTKN